MLQRGWQRREQGADALPRRASRGFRVFLAQRHVVALLSQGPGSIRTGARRSVRQQLDNSLRGRPLTGPLLLTQLGAARRRMGAALELPLIIALVACSSARVHTIGLWGTSM